ncbi:MAG TPA: hypothetical protein VGC59_03555 [Solirubrobacteraceae bacterium]|jgi:hypothetical protein
MSKSKKKKDEQAPAGVPDGICVAGHPRSARAVRRAKGWGGVAGVVLCTALALGAHLPLFDALLRGLAGGLVTYLVVWALALAVARQFVVAEVRARYEDVMAAREAARSDGS